jgi:MFS transporter, PAT family, solute carrier family 33 (acetyl-CoA transportor), member 1
MANVSHSQGGAYLTLLNTIANMGVILPKAPAFYLIDALTRTACKPQKIHVYYNPNSTEPSLDFSRLACPTKPRELAGPYTCVDAGGRCMLVHDGFYTVCWASIALGTLCGLVYLRALPKLMALPLSAWRAGARATKDPEHQE